ncbi:MAG: serine/threonine-protein kinase PknK, partial [bacterium]|nr:serine/threonine-protein kinase PknK [bacterium]
RQWKEHSSTGIESLRMVFQMGLEIGDFEFAAYSAATICSRKFFCSFKLMELEPEMAQLSSILEKIKQKTQLQMINIYHQTVLNLSGAVKEPYFIKGEIYNEDKMLPVHIRANDKPALISVYTCGYILSYLFNEYTLALENLKNVEIHLNTLRELYISSQFSFYDSLTRLALYDSLTWFEKKTTRIRIARNRKRLKKSMRRNPSNHSNKFYLVEAERMRILGRDTKAVEYYARSIECARENGFLHEEGIANERAAEFLLKKNEAFHAKTHLQAAHDCYSQWGAVAKVNQLKEKWGKDHAR